MSRAVSFFIIHSAGNSVSIVRILNKIKVVRFGRFTTSFKLNPLNIHPLRSKWVNSERWLQQNKIKEMIRVTPKNTKQTNHFDQKYLNCNVDSNVIELILSRRKFGKFNWNSKSFEIGALCFNMSTDRPNSSSLKLWPYSRRVFQLSVVILSQYHNDNDAKLCRSSTFKPSSVIVDSRIETYFNGVRCTSWKIYMNSLVTVWLQSWWYFINLCGWKVKFFVWESYFVWLLFSGKTFFFLLSRDKTNRLYTNIL